MRGVDCAYDLGTKDGSGTKVRMSTRLYRAFLTSAHAGSAALEPRDSSQLDGGAGDGRYG